LLCEPPFGMSALGCILLYFPAGPLYFPCICPPSGGMESLSLDDFSCTPPFFFFSFLAMRYKAQSFPFGKALSLISHCRKEKEGGSPRGVQKEKGPTTIFLFLFNVDIFNIYIKQKIKVDEVPTKIFLFLFNVDSFNIYIKQKIKVHLVQDFPKGVRCLFFSCTPFERLGCIRIR
jgi:hypothetical protein